MCRRIAVAAALAALISCGVLGCGSNSAEPLKTAPGTDTRSAEEKETDALLQKSQQEYNKGAR